MSLKIGDRFTVSAPHEVKNPKGRLLARYLPDFDYRVTDRNIGIVTQMVTDGVASEGGHALAREANRLASPPARVRGKVSVNPKKKDK